MEKVQENPEEDTKEDDFLEECENCGEEAVIRNGRCRTCLSCGNSMCSI